MRCAVCISDQNLQFSVHCFRLDSTFDAIQVHKTGHCFSLDPMNIDLQQLFILQIPKVYLPV